MSFVCACACACALAIHEEIYRFSLFLGGRKGQQKDMNVNYESIFFLLLLFMLYFFFIFVFFLFYLMHSINDKMSVDGVCLRDEICSSQTTKANTQHELMPLLFVLLILKQMGNQFRNH
jgi:magnesium-transporting ATPase (P-type)